VLLLCVLGGFAVAQNQRTGTAAATELLVPVGARDLAMGGASIASSYGVESIHWNPAGLGRLTHSAEGMFSMMSYIADINVNYGAVAASFGEFGIMALSVKSIDFGDIPLTTQEDPEGLGGQTYSPNYITLGLTYGRQLTDAISVGVTGKLISERIDRVSATGFAVDVGLQYNGLVGVRGLQLGVTVKNIGPQLEYSGTGLYRTAIAVDGSRPQQRYQVGAAAFELPSLIEIGVGYAGNVRDNMMYNVTGVFTNNNLYEDEYRLGGEYGINLSDVSLFARAGYGFVPQLKDKEEKIFGATLGVGLSYRAGETELTFDYAYRQVELFDGNNIFSLKIGF
jgi:hypothetical protein